MQSDIHALLLKIHAAFADMPNYVAQPFFYMSDPSKRIYWGFLLTSAIFGLLFSTIYRHKYGAKKALLDLINPTALFSRSSLVDLGLLVLNHVLRIVLFLPLIGGQIAIALFISRFFTNHVLSSPQIELAVTTVAVLYTLVFFILDDLSRFLLHLLMHKLPWLWHFHQLHHNAETLTPLTLYRFHPAEVFLLTVRSVLVGGFVSGCFVYLFAGRISGWDILGVNAVGFLFSALGSNLRHSHIPLSFGFLEKWFISPAQHQLHHSKEHIDINFGTYLAVWDRLFGSWIQGSPHQKLSFGLADLEDLADESAASSSHATHHAYAVQSEK